MVANNHYRRSDIHRNWRLHLVFWKAPVGGAKPYHSQEEWDAWGIESEGCWDGGAGVDVCGDGGVSVGELRD